MVGGGFSCNKFMHESLIITNWKSIKMRYCKLINDCDRFIDLFPSVVVNYGRFN